MCWRECQPENLAGVFPKLVTQLRHPPRWQRIGSGKTVTPGQLTWLLCSIKAKQEFVKYICRFTALASV